MMADNTPICDRSGRIYWDAKIETLNEAVSLIVAYHGHRLSVVIVRVDGRSGSRASLSPEQAIAAGLALIRAGTMAQSEMAKAV